MHFSHSVPHARRILVDHSHALYLFIHIKDKLCVPAIPQIASFVPDRSSFYTLGKSSLTMAITIEPIDVPGARSYYGNSLPCGLQVKSDQPDGSQPPTADAIAALKAFSASGKIQELLDRHGAVLIRGIGDPSAETFSDIVYAVEEAEGLIRMCRLAWPAREHPFRRTCGLRTRDLP